MTEIQQIHPLNFALKYDPPTLVLHYRLGDQPQELAHQVRVFVSGSVNAAEIVNELVREESVYFSDIPPEQVQSLK
jgi:hypothetical protein